MKFNNVAIPYLAYWEKKTIALYKMSKVRFRLRLIYFVHNGLFDDGNFNNNNNKNFQLNYFHRFETFPLKADV